MIARSLALLLLVGAALDLGAGATAAAAAAAAGGRCGMGSIIPTADSTVTVGGKAMNCRSGAGGPSCTTRVVAAGAAVAAAAGSGGRPGALGPAAGAAGWCGCCRSVAICPWPLWSIDPVDRSID